MPVTTKPSDRKNKHFILDQSRLKRAQKALGTRTETETIELALENAITEADRDKQAWRAHDAFVSAAIRSGSQIVDVYGRLEKFQNIDSYRAY